jgi:hypothetical protein
MAKPSFILIPGRHIWRIGAADVLTDVPVAADATPAEIAAAVAPALARRGYAGQGILLALPSAWCLAASISTAGLRRGDRDAMLYRLEEKLPLAAEAIVAEFLPRPAGDTALGVCVATDRVAPLVSALESAGVIVQSISPLALLALQNRADRLAPAETELLIWPDADQTDLFVLIGGVPTAWSLSRGGDDLALHRNLLLAQFDEPERTTTPGPLELIAVAATAVAAPVLTGRTRPWFELRRGALSAGDALRAHRRALNAALAAAALLLIALSAAMVYRGFAYDRFADAADARLRDDFRRDFAGWPEPPSVAATIASERRRLQAAGASALPPEARRSALTTLRQVLSRVPADGRFTLARATFNDTSVQLEGDAKSQADVEPLVEAARAAGLEVPPAQTRKTAAGTWSFVVRGDTPAAASQAASAQGRAEP